ncbi:MAG: neutral/alkaline non-lysosomal ceramidase N-terminal domain-containing protein [Eubacteriales bacterium]
MSTIFRAGAAREEITPAVGTLLFGYNPHQVSTSIHDPLYVTAAAFEEGGERVLLLTVTVCEFQTALAQEIREKTGEACGIPAANVLLSATHTHSAPNVAGMEGWGEVNRPYCDEILIPAILRASRQAMENLRPAEIGAACTESQVGINRRQLNRDGSISLGQNPWGCYDPTMTVVSIRGTDGTGILNLIHYGCHGTAAGCNREISRDWSGIMTDCLERETGVLTAYWNGAEGDVGPRLTNGATVGNITYVEELGGVAAADAFRAWRSIRSYHPGHLTLYKGEVRLPYKTLPSLEEVRAKLDGYDNPDALINVQRMEYAHWRDVEATLSAGITDHPTHFTFDQTLVSLGEILLVPFPFEMFSEIAIRMAAYTPWPHTLCLSCTNGSNAYLPSRDQLCRGGYEVLCFLFNNVYSMTDDADEQILRENLRILGI